MQKDELVNVVGGGFTLSAAYLNAISRAINTFYNLGRSIGSSLKSIFSHC